MFEYIKNRLKKDKWDDEKILENYPEINSEILTQIKRDNNDTSGTSVQSSTTTNNV